jgi:hypothetical protein
MRFMLRNVESAMVVKMVTKDAALVTEDAALVTEGRSCG